MIRCVLIALSVCICLVGNAAAEAPYDTSSWVGANYTPAYCVNQVQLWHDFRPAAIEKELAAAKKHFAITTLRVYLHNIVYNTEKDRFLERIDQFLTICRRHGIRPGFVFFDDCWNHTGIGIEQEPPVDGRHNGRWAACPQDGERTEAHLPALKAYVQDVVRAHREDERVLWWEVFNEPNRKAPFSAKLRTLGYRWIKEPKPIQPVLCCWDDSPETDIVDAHNYSSDFAGGWNRQADLNPKKGTVFTEAGARWYGKRGASNGAPIEVIHWLKQRRAAGRSAPGVYLCWELMVGNSHCRWYWGTKDGTAEPAIPWCGLLWPNATPVSLAEAEAVRSYVTGQKRALFFDDFQAAPALAAYPGWTSYGGAATGSRYLSLPPQTKMVAGDPGWKDYVVEATVMLKNMDGNAGLIVRVTDPGAGDDALRGYYVGFDPSTLYLGKMNYSWQELARYDLRTLPNPVRPDVWNLLRVAVHGPRIRVWFNALHDDVGLRFDFTHNEKPFLKGNIGARTHRTAAWFDDVVVLPIDCLPHASSDDPARELHLPR